MTLIVAKITANTPNVVVTMVCWAPDDKTAPTKVMPEIAFDPELPFWDNPPRQLGVDSRTATGDRRKGVKPT